MALPSSRMPKELMEIEAAEKAAKEEEEKRKQLVVRISKPDLFKKSMFEWYINLRTKEKGRLTPVLLKRRAIYTCSFLQIVYDTLPLDWVDEMRTKCGLKLYEKKKRTPAKASGGAVGSGAPVAGPSNGTSSSSPGPVKSERKLRSQRVAELKVSKEGGDPAVPITDQAAAPKPDASAPKKKRFLDLSKDPPPPYWLKCYAEGKVLPRVLTIYSTDDTNILFYDYNPKLKDCFGREVKLTPQPRINLDYLESLNFVRKAGETKDD